MCCNSWGCKELDTTELLNSTEEKLGKSFCRFYKHEIPNDISLIVKVFVLFCFVFGLETVSWVS